MLQLLKVFKRLWHSPTINTWANVAVALGNVAILLPIILVRFNAEEIAFFYLLAMANSFQLVFSFGFVPTISRFIAYGKGGVALDVLAEMSSRRPNLLSVRDAATNEETISVVVQVCRRVFFWISLAALLFLGIIGTLAIYRPVNMLEVPMNGWVAWAVVVMSLVVQLRFSYYRAYMQGMGAVALTNRITACFGMLAVVVGVVILLLGGGIVELVIGRQISLLTGLLFQYIFAKSLENRLWEHLPSCPTEFHFFRVIWASAWRSGLGHLMTFGLTNSLPFIFAQFATSAQLASFLLGYRLLFTVNQFSYAPFASKLPLLQRDYAGGESMKMLKLARRGMILVLWSYVMLTSVVLIGGELILRIIGANAQLPDVLVMILISGSFFLERFGAMHLQLYTLSNHVVWHIASFGYGAVLMFSLFPLFHLFGLTGLAGALLLSNALFFAPFCAWHSHHLLKVGFWRFERLISFPPAIALIFIFALTSFDQLTL